MTTAANAVIPEFTQADRLRKAREVTGMTKDQFADSIGVSRNTIAAYEAGKRSPRRVVVNAWALASGVPVEWIRDGWAPRGSNPEPTVLSSQQVSNVVTVAFRPEPDKLPRAS